MKFVVLMVLSISSIFCTSTSFAASRYSYDLLKFQAILASKDVEAALGSSTLDGIELVRINDVDKTISYRLLTENKKCAVDLVLNFEDGSNPNYQVASIGQKICR